MYKLSFDHTTMLKILLLKGLFSCFFKSRVNVFYLILNKNSCNFLRKIRNIELIKKRSCNNFTRDTQTLLIKNETLFVCVSCNVSNQFFNKMRRQHFIRQSAASSFVYIKIYVHLSSWTAFEEFLRRWVTCFKFFHCSLGIRFGFVECCGVLWKIWLFDCNSAL